MFYFSTHRPIFSNICQVFECPMQRTMLAAVKTTEERLIAPRCLMQRSAHLVLYQSQTCTVR